MGFREHLPPGDFFVDTVGHCFVCLEEVGQNKSCLVTKMYSFQYSAHYLNIDKRKVFDENVPVPRHLMRKVQRSKLKVELCEECSKMNEKLAKLYCQLDNVQMNLTATVSKIHEKFKGAEETGLAGQFRQLVRDSDSEKINIAQRIRMETLHKCTKKLNAALPRVLIPKISKKAKEKKAWPTFPDKDGMESSFAQKSKLPSPIKAENIVNPTNDSHQTSNEYQIEIESNQNYEDFCQESHENHFNSDNNVENEENNILSTVQPQPLLTAGNSDTNNMLMPQVKSSSSFTSILERMLADYPSASIASPSLFDSGHMDSNKDNPAISPSPIVGGNSKSNDVVCRYCNKPFSSLTNRRRHELSVHAKVRHFCPFCDKSYTQKFHLNQHKRTEHFGYKYHLQCLVCKSTFTTNRSLQKHMKNVCNKSGPVLHTGANFSTGAAVTESIPQIVSVHGDYHGELPLEEKQDTDDPLDIGADVDPLQELEDEDSQHWSGGTTSMSTASTSPMATSSNIDINRHTSTTTTTWNSSCKCNYCGKIFPSRGNLIRHVDSIHFQKRYHCNVCSMNYSQRYQLKMHKRRVHCDGHESLHHQQNKKLGECSSRTASSLRTYSSASTLRRQSVPLAQNEDVIFLTEVENCRTNNGESQQQRSDNSHLNSDFEEADSHINMLLSVMESNLQELDS